MPKLTIALCTYNREKYLSDSLRSILNQTYGEYSLLILDNASTDGTRSVIESFDDPRIQYIYFDENTGMTGNWLRAIALCKTEYLSIAHDDDIMEPELLAREIEVMDKYKDVLLVSCRSKFINEFGESIENKFNSPFEEDKVIEKYGYFKMAGEHSGAFFMSAPAAMFRANCLDKIDYSFFDKTGSVADTYWYLKINELGTLYLIGDALISYRSHSGQYSYNQLKARKEHMDYILPLLGEHLSHEKYESVKNAYENEIKITAFALGLTEKYEKLNSGYYLMGGKFVGRDLYARIKFLNSMARGREIKYVIWGCGSAGRQNKDVFEALLPNYKLTGYIDSFKTGELDGVPIYSPTLYDFGNRDYIIISTSTGGSDVMRFLEEKGLELERDFMIGNVERL